MLQNSYLFAFVLDQKVLFYQQHSYSPAVLLAFQRKIGRWMSAELILHKSHLLKNKVGLLLFKIRTQKRFKRTLIYFNTDSQYANCRENPLYQATTTDKRSKTMTSERNRLILF